jgi:pilus assembly protein CpaE
MPKYKVLVVADHEEKRLMLRQRLSRAEGVALVGFAGVDADIMTKIKGYAPHVVLLVQEQGDLAIMELAQRIYQGFPGCAVALLVPALGMDQVKAAMQSGVRQIISEDNLSTLNDALVQAAMFEQGRSHEVGGEPRVITVFSGKGGTGRTTIAVNLAVAMASASRRVALIDLNLNFGDAALLLNINAKDTISDLVQDKTVLMIDDIKSFSIQHSSGLSVLCAPTSPEFAEYINARHVEMLLNTMRPYYDFIVVDLPNDLNETTLTAIENSDDILMVARKDISNLRATKILLGILATLQQNEKVHLVINPNRKSIVNLKDFDRVLDTSVRYVLPEDIQTTQISQERGIPLVTGFPQTEIAREINHIAQDMINRSVRKDMAESPAAGPESAPHQIGKKVKKNPPDKPPKKPGKLFGGKQKGGTP